MVKAMEKKEGREEKKREKHSPRTKFAHTAAEQRAFDGGGGSDGGGGTHIRTLSFEINVRIATNRRRGKDAEPDTNTIAIFASAEYR